MSRAGGRSATHWRLGTRRPCAWMQYEDRFQCLRSLRSKFASASVGHELALLYNTSSWAVSCLMELLSYPAAPCTNREVQTAESRSLADEFLAPGGLRNGFVRGTSPIPHCAFEGQPRSSHGRCQHLNAASDGALEGSPRPGVGVCDPVGPSRDYLVKLSESKPRPCPRARNYDFNGCALQELARKLVKFVITTGASNAAPQPHINGLYMNAVSKKIAAEVDKKAQMPAVLCSAHTRRIPSTTCQLSATTVIITAVAT